jgi:hypothetical protein
MDYLNVTSAASGSLDIFDQQGRLRKQVLLHSGTQSTIKFGDDFSTGIYLYKFISQSSECIRGKIIITK